MRATDQIAGENDGGKRVTLTVTSVVVACDCQTRTRHVSCGTSYKTSAGSQTSERDGNDGFSVIEHVPLSGIIF